MQTEPTYEEDMHRRVLAVREAVHHQGALGEYGHANYNDGDDVQLLRLPLALAKRAA